MNEAKLWNAPVSYVFLVDILGLKIHIFNDLIILISLGYRSEPHKNGYHIEMWKSFSCRQSPKNNLYQLFLNLLFAIHNFSYNCNLTISFNFQIGA